jgi:transaldolase
MNKLDQLRTMTEVVADTGDIDAITRLKPQDATTNPSLLLKAAQLPRFAEALHASKAGSKSIAEACDQFAVSVGAEIVTIIPGRISTEVDSRLSFDTAATIKKAQQLIELYAKRGIDKSRVLIKIAATWEGIRAAEALERDGINCNLTLLFGFSQAQACADAGAFLISPFVGRILDWYKANTDLAIETADQDPGVQSVTRIYHHYKTHGYNTVVMGASFRNVGEIEALAGCDRLTISPDLLDALESDESELPRILAGTGTSQAAPPPLAESEFRWDLNEDQMATEKLAEGIRKFTADQIALEKMLSEL